MHRYLGLLLAGFLIISGISGSILVFYNEFDALLNPEVFTIAEAGQSTLDPQSLVTAIETSDSRLRVYWLPLAAEAKLAQVAYIEPVYNPRTGQNFDVSFDEVFINPVSAEITGSRKWGECCQRINFVPLIHKLHNRLLLPASVGRPIWGTVAILWTVMALIGLILTVPKKRTLISWWKYAWLPNRRWPFPLTTVQLHRATGLWFWLVILTISTTGISLTFDKQLFLPMVTHVSSLSQTVWEQRALSDQSADLAYTDETRFSFTAALVAARGHAEELGLDMQASDIEYSHNRGLYRIRFGNPLSTGLGINSIYVDAQSGEVLGEAVIVKGSSGDVVDAIRQPLHAGRAFGLPGRIIVFLTGWAVALMSITGVTMWYRRRRGRKSPGAAP